MPRDLQLPRRTRRPQSPTPLRRPGHTFRYSLIRYIALYLRKIADVAEFQKSSILNFLYYGSNFSRISVRYCRKNANFVGAA